MMPAKTVFVVDDEPVIVLTMTAILNLSGFRAKGFKNAEEAIHAISSECPDLLITDVSMPNMNGIELAILFKSLCPNCKILLFSGHMDTTDLLTTAGSIGLRIPDTSQACPSQRPFGRDSEALTSHGVARYITALIDI